MKCLNLPVWGIIAFGRTRNVCTVDRIQFFLLLITERLYGVLKRLHLDVNDSSENLRTISIIHSTFK